MKAATALKYLPAVLSVAILIVTTAIILGDSASLIRRQEDLPPVIDFTWVPLGPVDLREMRGFLKIKDDYALDFTTYRMRIVEIDRSYALPIDGLSGKEYEQPISLSLLADNPRVLERKTLTLEFTIADDRGQKTTVDRTLRLKGSVVSFPIDIDYGER